MRRALGGLLGLALLGTTSVAAAETRALTALDDARACTPLARGGFAVATGGGLVIVGRDGTIRSLTALDGLPDTRVHALAESPDGLWVGTEGGAALVTLDGAPKVARTAGDASVHATLVSGSGIYLGTWGRGVLRLADKGSSPAVIPSALGKHVAALAEHDGTLHVAFSDAPMARLDRGTLRPLANAPGHGQALASFDGRAVFGGIEGLYRFGAASTPAHLASVDARGLASSDRGLLVATYGSGLLSLAPGGAALRPESGVPRWVRGTGALGRSRCAATTEGLYVDEGAGWRRSPLGGLPSNDVTTLAIAPDARVVIGTFDRGAAIEAGGVVTPIQGLEPNETVNASAWQDGAAWLGTAHGLVRVDARGSVVRRVRAADGLPSSLVRAVQVLASGRLLVGTDDGAAYVDGQAVTPLALAKKGAAGVSTLASPMHATWAVAEAADGTIFLGTASGLYWGKDGSFARASLATGELKDDWVTALAVVPGDGPRRVFVGTYSGGVSRLDFAAERPSAIHLGGGYVNPDGLLLDGTALVAATMDGLVTRPLADEGTKWDLHASASTGRDVTAARRAGGAIWVASRRGIAIVTP